MKKESPLPDAKMSLYTDANRKKMCYSGSIRSMKVIPGQEEIHETLGVKISPLIFQKTSHNYYCVNLLTQCAEGDSWGESG